MDYGRGWKLAAILVAGVVVTSWLGGFFAERAGEAAPLMRFGLLFVLIVFIAVVTLTVTNNWKKSPKKDGEERDLLDSTDNPKVLGEYSRQKYAEKSKSKGDANSSLGRYYGFEKE